MRFKEKISNYILGNDSKSQLPEIGLLGLKENLESESLTILAEMNEKNNSSDIEEYFKKALIELDFKEPNKLEAAQTLLVYYLKEMISTPINTFELMMKIENEIYKKIDWNAIEVEESKYLGKVPGIEKLFFWYAEIYDLKQDIELEFGGNEPVGDHKLKIQEYLIKQAKELLEKV